MTTTDTAGWTLRYGEHTWTEQDLTAGHAYLVAEVVGVDSWQIQPTSGPRGLIAWLAVLTAGATGRELLDVLAEINALTLAELTSCITRT